MVAEFSAEEILDITAGRLAAGIMPDEVGPISIDTRTLSEGSWFLALNGPHFDGHDFIGDAFAAGALGCIVQERPNYPIAGTSFPLIALADPKDALHELTFNWRKRIDTRILLVIGEPYRKKPLITILCKKVTERSFDPAEDQFEYDYEHDQVVPALLGILSLDATTKAFVLNAGGQKLTDVAKLAQTLQPNVLLVLDQGLGSLGFDVDANQLMDTYSEVLKAMDTHGCVISVNAPDDFVELASKDPAKELVQYTGDKNLRLILNNPAISPEHLWGAAEACRRLGFDNNEINEAFVQ